MNANVLMGFRAPEIQQQEPQANALMRAYQVKALADQSDMNALKAQEYRRGVEAENALNDAYRGSVGPNGQVDRTKLYSSLAQGGQGSKLPGIQKQFADADKTEAERQAKLIEIGTKRADHMGQSMGWLRQNPTMQNAQAVVANWVQTGIIQPDQAQAAIAAFQADPTPEGIARQAELGFRTALSAKDQLAQFQTRNTGGTTDTIAVDPVTRQAQVVNSVQNTQSPDNVATNARVAADNAASRAVQIRGQNMTDARQREANAITGGKPSAAVEKELVGIRQQNAIIDGALAAVEKTPSAFSLTRGMATMAGALPESLAGRMDSDAERQARSYVYNNVSKVINERAGAAQSAQELARLRSFLPAETDNAQQIKSKLTAFKTYLSDMESGTKGTASKSTGGASGGWSIQKVQ